MAPFCHRRAAHDVALPALLIAVLRWALMLPLSSEALPSRVQGRQLLVMDAGVEKPIHMKGINWNPVGLGGYHPVDLNYRGYVETDGRFMQEAGVNVLRTYECLTDRAVLDSLWARRIQVINTVWANAADSSEAVRAKIDSVKDHPAILMWAVGNEWNYNGCYQSTSHDHCLGRVREVLQIVKQHDTKHAAGTVYGELPTPDTLAQLPEAEVWGINYYNMDTFSDLFARWKVRSHLPMFLAEYGADAYNSNIGAVDLGSHAHATRRLTSELVANSALLHEGNACIGGLIFELTDEWWKVGSGSPHFQDVGGVAPGGGPYPDRVFNEEYWGLLDINRVPREAYHAFAAIPIPAEHQAAAVVGDVPESNEPNANLTSADGAMRISCTMHGCTWIPAALPGSPVPSVVHGKAIATGEANSGNVTAAGESSSGGGNTPLPSGQLRLKR